MCRVSGSQADATWCRSEGGRDNVAPYPDHLAVVVTACACRAEDRPRLVQQNADPEVLQHAERGVVHRRDFVG